MNPIKIKVLSYLEGLETKFSGALLLSIGDDLILNQGFGYANFEHDIQNTPETKFRIGSVTKQMTAVAVLKLVEAGQITLESFVSDYMDYPNGDKITIHQLLTHSSGIFNYTTIDNFSSDLMRKAYTPESLLTLFKELPMSHSPGAKYEYSNSGYHLLGMIIEKVSGLSYEQFIVERLFAPLKMISSGYDGHLKLIKGRANGYSLTEEGQMMNADFIDMTIPFSAGGLYSTTGDLLLWNEALHHDGILSMALYKKMMTPYIDDNKGSGYGYGIRILKKANNMILHHAGGIPGFFTANRVYVENDINLIMVTNINDMAFTTHVTRIEEMIHEHLNRHI